MVQALKEIINIENFDEASLKEAFSDFECVQSEREDSQDVRNFLMNNAIDMERKDETRTYLFINDAAWKESTIKIDGYFSLAIKIFCFSKKADKAIVARVFGDANKTNCPAYLIGQIGRGKDTESGLGRELLETALRYISLASDTVGGRLVYLDCHADRQAYYEKCGFCFLQQKHKSDLIQMYRII